MKFIKKEAECVSITEHGSDTLYDWRCPSCGMGVAEDYVCCPYCRQKLIFKRPNEINLNDFGIKIR